MGKINIGLHAPEAPGIRILMCGYVEKMNPHAWLHPNRISPFWRFYWGAEEGARLQFRDREVLLEPQTVVFVPPETAFATEAVKPFSQLYIHFEWAGEKPLREPVALPAAEEQELLNSIRNWYETEPDAVSLRMYALLFHYLIRLQNLPLQTKKIDQRIRKAVRLIDDLERNLSFAEIAREVSMSYYHFMETFKRQLGITPGQYKMAQRMSLAQHLLRTEDLTIEEIAFKTGFSNRFHFSKVFRQFFKLPPAACRKNMNNADPGEMSRHHKNRKR